MSAFHVCTKYAKSRRGIKSPKEYTLAVSYLERLLFLYAYKPAYDIVQIIDADYR